MDIHKPKAWHGARELAKEIGTIVVGVLIALGAEQVAQTLQGRHVVHEAEAAMRSELLDDDLLQAYARIAVTPCMARDLDGLKSAVDGRAPPQQFGVLAEAYHPLIRTWDQDAWKAAGASGAATRMDGPRLLGWSLVYVQIPFLQTYASRENDATERLQRSRYRSGAWTPQRAEELGDIVDELRTLNRYMAGASGTFLTMAKAHDMQLSPAAEQRLIAEARKDYGDCVVKPNLDLVPAWGEQVISRERWKAERKSLGIIEP